jgi:PAS domain S-box-containing protein
VDLATILDSTTDQVFAFDRDWRYIYLNRRAAEQMRSLGKDPGGVIGKVLWDIFPHVPNEATLRRVMAWRVAETDELFYPPLARWVENYWHPGPDGGVVNFQRYVTGRNRTQVALRSSEERFRRYFDLGLIGMAITAPSKGCVEVNDELCRMLGYDRAELLRLTWSEITHPDDLPADIANFNRVLAGEIEGYSTDKRWIRKDGRVIDTIMSAKCVRRPDGSVDYFIGLVQEITERKLLHKLQGELAHVARMATLGELAASIAHEVNQPLAAVVTNGQACLHWLAATPPELGEAVDAVERLVRDANRAAEVITRIRAFLKRDPAPVAAMDLDNVIAEVIAMVRSEIVAQGVTLQVDSPAGLPAAAADRIQVQQVILNLVMNALESMSGVTDRPRRLQIDVAEHGADALLVRVRDSGVGLAPTQTDAIFDAFHTTKPNGMGMGLAISRSIVEAHGGRLWAAANEGPGATFEFTLALAGPDQGNGSLPTPSS